MPSSPPLVRPILAALLAVLLLTSSALVSGPATLLPAADAAGPAGTGPSPEAPPDPPGDSPVSMDLVSLDPTSLAPGGMVQAEVEVTNTSSQPLSDVELELRTRTSRVTDRAMVADWQADSSPDTTGPALTTSPEVPQLEPGESATLSIEATAEELAYSEEPYFWGTRRISLTVVADEEPLAAIRSFVVWRPAGTEDSITQSVLLPVAALDASAPVTAPEAHAQSAESGRLASLEQLALREDVDWWLDPALLDPPQLPVEPEEGTPAPDDAEGEEEAPQSPREYEAPAPASEMADALGQGVGDRTVLGMPYARADLVSLREAGADGVRSAAEESARSTWEEADIASRASAMRLEGPNTDAAGLQRLADAGATTAIVPSTSLRADAGSSVTPSSVGVVESTAEGGAGSGSELPVLAPDPVLSSEFSQLTGDSDTEQTRQRLLAETATIASEYTDAPRHLLIAPDPEASLDAAAAGSALDALAAAPWVEPGRTGDLLDAADHRSWTTDPQSESGELLALGRLSMRDVRPSGPGQNGRWGHLDEAESPQLLDPDALADLEGTWNRLDALGAAMEDDTPLEAPRLEVLAGTSVRWRGSPEVPAERAQDAAAVSDELQEKIQVVPASGYNLISDSVGVPITITNQLDTPIRVRTAVSSDRPLVRIGEAPVVEVPAQGQVDATVPVEAIANGTVTLTTVLTAEDGQRLTEPVDVPLTVNPAWENWTTLLLVIAMGVLMVVGVARARRTGSATRAPAVHGPEDPVELSRTGRSMLDTTATEAVVAEDEEAEQHSEDEERHPPGDSGPPGAAGESRRGRRSGPATHRRPINDHEHHHGEEET
ncbi:DUF6049 family protein [Brachybacterium sp. GCM10030252]|uniref:DUF6049 family protein n=1 Tax=Brachybacterium sp. GCM10030252 TaxID=3273380 RepID=UPI003623CF3B